MHKEHFEVVLADDEVSRRIHYQLRYQVFCLDTGYEDPAAFPNGEEKDGWDRSSAHFLVRERETQHWVAAMRLVSHQNEAFPIDMRTTLAPGLRLPAEKTLEISRLCMVGHYRRRLQGQAVAVECEHGNVTSLHSAKSSARADMNRRLRTADILRSLLAAGLAYSRENGTRHWYIFTTRALAKVLGQVLPLDLRQAGDPAWHRGERFPFLVDIQHLLDSKTAVNFGSGSDRSPAFRRHSELRTSTMARAVGAE